MPRAILSVKDMEKTYPGGVHAVRGISFEVMEGESVAIIGSSGSGKSTVLRCINRLIEPTKGVVRLKGEQINTPAAGINEVRSRIGMVFQSFELFAHLKVLDNITLGLIHVRGMSREKANEEAKNVLDRVDMLDRVDAYPGNLSGGQKQRMAFTMALLTDPSILVLDDTTSALDAKTEARIQITLDRIMANRTTFVITHRISTAQRADQILVLDNGRMAGWGTDKKLVAQPGVYQDLYVQQQAQPESIFLEEEEIV